MNLETKANRWFQFLYPIGVYYILQNLCKSILYFIFPQQKYQLLWLGVASAITIPAIYGMYKKYPIVKPEKQIEKDTICKELMLVVGIVGFGIASNWILTQLSFVQNSSSLAKVNETLFFGSVIVKIFTNCIAIPILEELVYRGMICGQLLTWGWKPKSVVFLSAFLFGVMHFNLVQFLYAFLMGVLLGASYCKTRKVWIVMFAHGLTNLVVVLCYM